MPRIDYFSSRYTTKPFFIYNGIPVDDCGHIFYVFSNFPEATHVLSLSINYQTSSWLLSLIIHHHSARAQIDSVLRHLYTIQLPSLV